MNIIRILTRVGAALLFLGLLSLQSLSAQDVAPITAPALSAPGPALGTPVAEVPAAAAAGLAGNQTIDRPLQVTGQNRNFAMSMMLTDDADQINFVDVRHDYADEIEKTPF